MIRIGIIGSGFGRIGLKPAFESVRGCKVVGICEHRDAWKDFLNKTPLDAVAVAVPPHAQCEIVKEALRLGLHVFAEKPLAANLVQAKELYQLAKRKKVVTAVDFIFPEIAEWQRAKKFLEEERLGKLRSVSVVWEWLSGDVKYGRSTWKSSIKNGGGALAFYFSHGLWYLENFAGEIVKSRITFERGHKKLNGGETGFDLFVEFRSGAIGNIHLSSTAADRIRHELRFQCDKGTLELVNKNAIVDGFSLVARNERGERKIRVRKDKGKYGEDERVKVVRKLAYRFIRACERGTQMRPSFTEGLRVQELIEAVRKTA